MDKNFKKELFALAVPFALQGLLNSLVGASDALMLGRLTQESISAVSLANQITFILTLVTGGFFGAVGVLIAQYYGKKDFETVKKLLGMAIRISIIVSGIFFLCTFFIPDKLMLIFTNEPELVEIGASYLRIVGFSYLFSSLTQVYLIIMKIDGRAKLSVWISLVTVIVDMGLDFFLIYGFGKIPSLGADGSAYSTIVVEVIAFIWVLIASFEKEKIHPNFSSLFTISGVLEKDMIKIALPMLASALAWGLSMSAHSSIMGHLGIDATAAFSVVNVAISLIQCFSQGIAHGISIMIGGVLGRNDLEKAKEYGKYSWILATIMGVIDALLVLVVGPLVYYFYVLEPLAKQYLVKMLAYNMLYMFAFSYNDMFTVGVFPAGGDSRYDAESVFIATWCLALPLAAIGAFVLKWPVMVVYMVMRADEIVKFPFLIPRYKKYIWLKNLTRDDV